ncbi:hypothetical protein [Virgibacillus sp. LDC-1]|uniref:hypothetical protein n=1 Tax=Virgibacillus sp. LDC-1 TaxID=3039856 RepID=UPI0024DE0480|nr:hypothetical protein [Virgibacillus sp. LDC-1]
MLRNLINLFLDPSIKERITTLEAELLRLKQQAAEEHVLDELRMLQEKLDQFITDERMQPIHIKKIDVDRIYIDKYETNNNIGALGIKELGGRLNIGANYGQGMSPPPIPKHSKKEMDENTMQKVNIESPPPSEPTINIRGKK